MAKTKKGYFGENNPNWKSVRPNCVVCKKTINSYTKGARFHKDCYHRYRREHTNRGKVYNSAGYIRIYFPEHPYSDKGGYIFEHRICVERKIGRYLLKKEHVHHINHIKDDNRIENLMILSSSEHSVLHHKGRRINKEQRQRMSDAQKGNKKWLGRSHTEETRIKMSNIRTNYWDRQRGLN